MITRVWGIVNEQEIVFSPLIDRPGYWEGYADGQPGLQDIEIWAENDQGVRGHIQCTVSVNWITKTKARLLIYPYIAKLLGVTNGRVDLIRLWGREARLYPSIEY